LAIAATNCPSVRCLLGRPRSSRVVNFVDVSSLTAWVSGRGVESVLSGMCDYLEADFRRWSAFDRTPRVASHSLYGVIELMPTSDETTYSFKYVNGHPINTKRDLQTVTAFGVLADVESGYPTFMAEMTVLTALRTAATSAMVARRLAPRGASTLALIGAGAQSEFQALAFRSVLDIATIRIWDTDPEAMSKLERNLRPLGFNVIVAASVDEAIAGAEILTTCTADKTNATILSNEMVGAGVHINAIGGDCPGKTELDSALLRRADIFVEYTPQTRIEGEIQQLAADHPVTEVWEVLAGSAPGRVDAEQITIFDSVGFAIEDFSALRYVCAGTAGTSYQQSLDLIAEPLDPKNLYSLLRAPATADFRRA